MGIELAIREISAQHQQHVAIEHRVVAGRKADQSGHADIEGIVPLDMLLAAQRMDHRRLETFAQREKLAMRTGAARAAQHGHPPLAVQKRGQPVEVTACRRHDRSGQ